VHGLVIFWSKLRMGFIAHGLGWSWSGMGKVWSRHWLGWAWAGHGLGCARFELVAWSRHGRLRAWAVLRTGWVTHGLFNGLGSGLAEHGLDCACVELSTCWTGHGLG
jgi:hypothetical protein